MSTPLRWSLVTADNAHAFAPARRTFHCSGRDSPSYVLTVESFLRDEPLERGEQLLLGQFGPDTAAMAWLTAQEGCVSKLLAYGVHPAYRSQGQTAQDLLARVVELRRAAAQASYCPGFLLWCYVDPRNVSSRAALQRAHFTEAEPDGSRSQRWQYIERLP